MARRGASAARRGAADPRSANTAAADPPAAEKQYNTTSYDIPRPRGPIRGVTPRHGARFPLAKSNSPSPSARGKRVSQFAADPRSAGRELRERGGRRPAS
jgi:hypothetical protein